MDVVVSLTTPGCPIRAHFEKAVVENVSALDGVETVNVAFDVLSDDEKQGLAAAARPPGRTARGRARRRQERDLRGVGQGRRGQVHAHRQPRRRAPGRGPSGGRARRRRVGLLDPAHARRSRPPAVSPERKILPLEAHGGVSAISIEFFLSERDQAITWRGPMLHKAIRQFLEDVDWGELDYLLIDLPPGTGDVSMTLAQLLPQARFVIVTTPQPAAQNVAKRAAETALRFDLEIAGVIENMSGLHDARRRALHDLRRGRRAAARRRPRRAAARQGPAPGGAAGERRHRPAARASTTPTRRPRRRRHAARGLIAATPQELAVFQAPSGPPVPEVTGTALPMAPSGGS